MRVFLCELGWLGLCGSLAFGATLWVFGGDAVKELLEVSLDPGIATALIYMPHLLVGEFLLNGVLFLGLLRPCAWLVWHAPRLPSPMVRALGVGAVLVALWRIPALLVLCEGAIPIRDPELLTLPVILEILPTLLGIALPVGLMLGMWLRRWRAGCCAADRGEEPNERIPRAF